MSTEQQILDEAQTPSDESALSLPAGDQLPIRLQKGHASWRAATKPSRIAARGFKLAYNNPASFAPDNFVARDVALWSGRTVVMEYGPRFNWFTHHLEYDSVGQSALFNLLWPLARTIWGIIPAES